MTEPSAEYAPEVPIFALVTTQGTAMPETALCADHVEGVGEHLAQAIANAFASADWNESVEFVDCTGNDQLHCLVCGRPTEPTLERQIGDREVTEPSTDCACPNCGSTDLDTLEIATCVAVCNRITSDGPDFSGWTEYERGSQRTVGVWCNGCEWSYIVPEWRDAFAKVEAPGNENEWLAHLVPAQNDRSENG